MPHRLETRISTFATSAMDAIMSRQADAERPGTMSNRSAFTWLFLRSRAFLICRTHTHNQAAQQKRFGDSSRSKITYSTRLISLIHKVGPLWSGLFRLEMPSLGTFREFSTFVCIIYVFSIFLQPQTCCLVPEDFKLDSGQTKHSKHLRNEER